MRIRDRRVRLALAVVLLLLIALAAYHIGLSLWADRQYRAAWAALERYDYSQAGACLEKYLSVWPGDPTVRLLAAQVARQRGDFDEAVRQLREAERLGVSRDTLAVERQLLSVQAGDLSNYDRLMQVCIDRPDSPEAALILEAIIEGSLKTLDLPRAKAAVDQWLQHRHGTADQAQGHVWRGRVLAFAQNFPQALADFRQAVELDPDHTQARLHLAEALIRDDPRQAIEHLEWLRHHRPDDPEVWFQSARLRRSLGQPEEAGRLLDRVLAETPNKVPALVERGRIAMDLNDPREAEGWLRHALSLAPEQREVNLVLGDCLRQAGRLDEAKRYQDRGQEIADRLKRMLDELAGSGKIVGGSPERPAP